MTSVEAISPWSRSPRLAPRWSRPLLLLVIVAAHAAAMLGLSTTPPVTPLPAIVVDFAPLPAAEQPPPAAVAPSVPETPPEPEAAAPEAPPAEPLAVPPPPEASAAVEEPPIEAIVPPPSPPIEPPKSPDQPKPPKPVKPSRPTVQPQPGPAPVARPARPQSAPVSAGSPATSGAAPAMSPAAYAGLVAAELNRHKAYPEAARAAGAVGSVGVAFTIGPSGRATSIAITASSGNAALDGAARQAVASIRVPPPPAGLFRTATTIRFNLR